MGTRLLITNPREIGYGEYEERDLKENEVRLKTIYSGLSIGTELTVYRGINPYMLKTWDSSKKLFVKAEETSLKFPTETGYEAVGQIIETGAQVSKVKAGDVVYGGEWYAWTHKTTHILSEDAALRQSMPAHVNPKLGVFVPLLQTSFNGILDSQVNLGETTVAFGAGIVGQLALQFLKLSGAEVIVVDLIEERLATAKKLGADEVIDGSKINVGEYIKDKTNGRGADVCIEAAGNDLALHESIRCCAYSGKVISLGFNPNPATRLNLGEEFHHNRITIVCSQIAGVNPALLNRWDVYRVEDAVVKMLFDGKLNLEPLITHEFDFADGQTAYDLADKNPRNALQILFKYS
jgi:2-desacetyl-2-hydroxyethyl bacteriochlorophyllide A dehydrogenase